MKGMDYRKGDERGRREGEEMKMNRMKNLSEVRHKSREKMQN